MPTTTPTPDAPPVTASAADRPLSALVALLTLVVIELVRSSGPLLDMAFALGVTEAAGAAVVTYALPGLIAVVLLATGRRDLRRAVVTGALVLAVARLVVQALTGWPRFGVGLLTVAIAVAVLTLAVAGLARHPGGGGVAARAIALGAAASVGVQLLLGTWDAYWRHDVVGWLVTLVSVGAVVAITLRLGPGPAGEPLRPGRLWALGPTLALLAMMLANPAFAASQTSTPLAVAGPVAGVGLLLAARAGRTARTGAGRRRPSLLGRPGGVVDALVAVLATTVLLVAVGTRVDGLLLLVVVAAQVCVVLLLGRALEPSGAVAPGRVRTRAGAAASLVGLGTILPLLVHQLDYDIPLGFPNELVVIATVAVLGLTALGRPVVRAPAGRPTVRGHVVVIGAAVLVLAGSTVAVAEALQTHAAVTYGPTEEPGTGSGRVLSWNLHYGVEPSGGVDLEHVAETIEAQDAEVLLLQEVSRGWVMGGGADVATWLANRLDKQVVFAPAADRQFGNAVMPARGADQAEVIALPYGVGPQNRSAAMAQVPLGEGDAWVVSVHLQHRESSTETRLAQIEVLLDALPDGEVLVGGDFNAEPGWPEIEAMTDAGFVSAQDAVGDPSLLTSPAADPQHRIDWVFGREMRFTEADVLTGADSSDHLPLVVQVRRP